MENKKIDPQEAILNCEVSCPKCGSPMFRLRNSKGSLVMTCQTPPHFCLNHGILFEVPRMTLVQSSE